MTCDEIRAMTTKILRTTCAKVKMISEHQAETLNIGFRLLGLSKARSRVQARGRFSGLRNYRFRVYG